MSQLDQKLYDERTRNEWFDELSPNDVWLRRHFFALCGVLGTPGSLLDIGCGTGIIPKLAFGMGIRPFGVDQLVYHGDDSPYDGAPEDKEIFFEANLSTPFSLGALTDKGEFSLVDWVLCFEVAEHIGEDFAPVFCDNLANHVGRNGLLIFTAAHPGQGGSNHVNNQPASYWRNQFHKRGMNYQEDLTIRVVAAWGLISSPNEWLLSNLQIFRR